VFRSVVLLIVSSVSAASNAVAQTPTAGQNVNMVSGTQWPGGDPFLQRQNEPSLAVSSRNSQHLLAGANDYRTVDLPLSDTVPGTLAGDAWLGIFKSFDGGQTWQSYLVPGYPQDQSPVGQASPLKGFSAAADPTVRAGTGGVFYYSGIAFNRGTNNGAVFVTTFFDANRKENGNAPAGTDTIQYQKTVLVDSGTSGQFLDKTWIAVDIPRAGAATCTFNAFGQNQMVQAGNAYLVWSRFTGSQSTKIMFSRSLDCGNTWSNPIKLSESSSINQGTNVAIDPTSGAVYVVWRQFATSSNPDSILVARSDDFGATFPNKNTTQVATITPFDQSMTGTRFRTNALPSIAASVDSHGTSRVHVAWAQRSAANQDAQIVVSTSSNGGKTWSNPVPVDSAPLTDDVGNVFTRGHQFMPQITFAAGRLMVLYYDQRLDHTLSLFKPQDSPFLGVYTRKQAPRGELVNPGGVAGFNLVFTPFIDDDATVLPRRRHTIDLRVAEALPAASPSFTSASVSRYRMGLYGPDALGVFRDDEDQPTPSQPPDSLQQLQVNVPNLPMFALGTVPFLGDYIDIAGQNFVPNGDGTWSFNTSGSSAPLFYASWTDNRDVVPPVDPATGLVDWTKYTPPVSPTNLGDGTSASIYDPTKLVPACGPAFTGSRNQNIYLSRISEGLLVGSPQDAKPLDPVLQRAFVVTLQNLTKDIRSFHVSIANQPPGGQASFLQTGPVQTGLDLSINGGAGAARPVFVTSSSPAASITVNVVETTASGSLGLSGSIVLNPEGSVSALVQPDGSTANIGGIEVYTPSFEVWNPANPNPYVNIADPNAALHNQNVTNQNVTNADPAILNLNDQNVTNQNVTNQNVTNQNVTNASPAVQNVTNQNVTNQNVTNTTAANQNVTNQNVTNQNVTNQNVTNIPITDATYAVTNTGNTAHSYKVALFGNNGNHAELQLIVTKNSNTPTAAGCTLQSVPQSIVLARSDAPVVSSTLSDATNPDITDGTLVNGTVPIGPGETVFLTLRGNVTHDQMATLLQQLTPVITAHGANTGNASSSFALLLSIQTTGGTTLPAAVVGTPYTTTLQAVGGNGAVTWMLVGGALPGGLTLSPSGTISGTPSASGAFAFTIQVTDSSSPVPQSATQSFSLTVAGRKTTSSLTLSPSTVLVLQGSTAAVTVTDTEATGTPSAPAGTVTVSGAGVTGGACVLSASGPAQSSCSVSVSATAAGTNVVTASYAGSSTHQASAANANLTVNILSTSSGISFSNGTVVVGLPSTVTATITNTSPGATTAPTGSVTFSSSIPTDTFTPASSCALTGSGTTASCSVSVTASSASPHVITINYPGVAGVFQSSTTSLTLQVNKRSTSTAISVAPSPLSAGAAGTVSVTVTDTEPSGAKSSPSGTVNFSSTAADSFNPGASCNLVAGVAGVSACSTVVSGTAVGNRTISASYPGSSAHLGSGSSTNLTITGSTTTMITSDSPAPSFQGQAVTVGFAVAPVAPAVGMPTGTVTVTNGAGGSCVATLPTMSCSLVLNSAGTVTLTATYSGDAFFSASAGNRLHTVAIPYTFIGFISPLSAAGTLTAPSDSGSGNFSKGLPIKWQVKDSSGNFVTSLTSTQTLQAVYYAGGVCTTGQATGQAFLLYQPTSGATGGSTFRYDSNANQFLFNWSTKSVTTGPGCYELVLQLNDGSTPKATRINLQ
jgi:hypothetical protein